MPSRLRARSRLFRCNAVYCDAFGVDECAGTYMTLKLDHVISFAALFFLCGLPGYVDYLTLIAHKLGRLDRLTQKRISSLVQISLRMPGILWCCFLAYQIGLASPNNRGYVFVTSALSALNGLYFGYVAIRNYGESIAHADMNR